MRIRHSTEHDFNRIMDIYCFARRYMAEHGNPNQWSPKVTLKTKKSYMQGYYKLDDPNIKGIHRFLAKLCDSLAKMYIYRMEFTA